MPPEWKALRKRSKRVVIPEEPYFALADEYVQLKAQFVTEELIDTLYSWFDMVIYPIYIIVRLCMLDFSPMYAISLVKTYQRWIDWFRLQELEDKVESWKRTVRSVGGPWISTNNPDLHVFVYADSMERIRHSKIVVKNNERIQRNVGSAK